MNSPVTELEAPLEGIARAFERQSRTVSYFRDGQGGREAKDGERRENWASKAKQTTPWRK